MPPASTPSRSRRRAPLLLTLLAALSAAPACDPLQGSRVARGQLVTTGVGQYDEYFRKVHDAQDEGRAWSDERANNRKALASTLGLPAKPSSEALVAALRERVSSGTSLRPVVEVTAHGELARADRVEARAPAFEELANQADDLRPRVKRDLPNDAAKRRSTESELAAAAEELRHLAVFARSHAHEARRFVGDLSGVTGATYTPRATPAPSAPPAPKKPPPRSGGAPKPAEPKPAEPKPPAPPSPEVFTP